MSDIDLNYDLRPYIPDIYIKGNIFNSFDSVNMNNSIGINTSIFIFNINEPLTSNYNDPSYLLFGIKKDNIEYNYPSLNFFSNSNTTKTPYETTIPIFQIDSNIKKILESIGYNLMDINESQFQYQELIINTSLLNTNSKSKIIYMYFNFISNQNLRTNYNKYASTTYYDNKYWNIIIYPYINLDSSNTYISNIISYEYSLLSNGSNKKNVDKLNFDDRENIKYYTKIDYKYFENINYTMDINNMTHIETLRNVSNYIKNYHNYMKQTYNENPNSIYLNLNEISKIFYPNIEYNYINSNTYTNIHLNDKYINNNKCYSSNINKYSYSSDTKISNLNFIKYPNKSYSSYNYDKITNSTLYQKFINYYVNSYFDLLNNKNALAQININLHKIFVYINPQIIDLNYLLSNIKTKITPLFEDSNLFEFGSDSKKLQLFMVGNFKPTELYYLSKYKIEFIFEDNQDSTLNFSYVIILGIIFYDSNKMNILNKSQTLTMNDLAYINYTVEENTVSLSPTIINFNENLLIYETMSNINITDIKKYMYKLDYSFLSNYNNQNNFIQFNNFYTCITNNIINLRTGTNPSYLYKNIINIKMLKINNFIKNFINIDDNFNNLRSIETNIKSYLNYSILYDENIIFNNTIPEDINKYIEYFDYFPIISPTYINNPNYYGKYYPNLESDNYIILPAGKYIKFNYINLISIYPIFPDEKSKENFVKSVKNIFEIMNWNFSLLIKIPYNINMDDNFYCSNPKSFWSSQYAANICGNHTNIYLVLNDENNNPYTFYSENNNGIIYAIKLFNYYNFTSPNLTLDIKLNLFYNKYINLSQLIILSETYHTYTDKNTIIWNINKSFLKLHNITNLKEILTFDLKRFQNSYDNKIILEQLNNFNYKTLLNLFNNKLQLNDIKYDIKNLIYISNLFKTLILIKKCYNYCEIISTNIMMCNYNNDLLIDLIKYNINIISKLYQINYDLDITCGTFDTLIYYMISKINTIDLSHNLENINAYQKKLIYILNYSNKKINIILNLVGEKDINNLYKNIYLQIYELMAFEYINFNYNLEISNDIDNLIDGTNLSNCCFETNKLTLLLKQIKAYLQILVLNLTKIDELFNLILLMGNNTIDDYLFNLNLKVVKNTFIYNTQCYYNSTNIPTFDIINFLTDTKNIIIYSSTSINNPTTYENYQKSIQEGIITFIDNTITNFSLIIEKIVNIYKYQKNIPGIANINIYSPDEIGDFYIVLTEFNINYNSMFDIINGNKINIFIEYTNLFDSFNNLFNSCQEFLLSIRLWNDFMNPTVTNPNIFINVDLYKIISIDIFKDFLTKTINNFNNFIINKNPNILILYLEKMTKNVDMYFVNKFKPYIVDTLNKMLLQLNNQINNNIPPQIPIIMYGSFYIISYADLLLFKEKLLPASFNFSNSVLSIINSINQINGTIFNIYYNEQNVIPYINLLGYTYLSTPFKYINIDNGIINE